MYFLPIGPILPELSKPFCDPGAPCKSRITLSSNSSAHLTKRFR